MLRLKLFFFAFLAICSINRLDAQDTLLLENGTTMVVNLQRIDNNRFYFEKDGEEESMSKYQVKMVKFSAGWKVDLMEETEEEKLKETKGWRKRKVLQKKYLQDPEVVKNIKEGRYGFLSVAYARARIRSEKSEMFNIAPTLMTPKGWLFSLHYNGPEVPSENLPSDYDPGLCFFMCGTSPGDQMHLYGIGAGKVFYAKNPLIRATLEGGVDFINSAKANFTESESSGLIDFGSNYDVHYGEKKFGLGLYFKTTLELPFSTAISYGIFLKGHLNGTQSFYQIGIFQNWGHVRNRIVPKEVIKELK